MQVSTVPEEWDGVEVGDPETREGGNSDRGDSSEVTEGSDSV